MKKLKLLSFLMAMLCIPGIARAEDTPIITESFTSVNGWKAFYNAEEDPERGWNISSNAAIADGLELGDNRDAWLFKKFEGLESGDYTITLQYSDYWYADYTTQDDIDIFLLSSISNNDGTVSYTPVCKIDQYSSEIHGKWTKWTFKPFNVPSTGDYYIAFHAISDYTNAGTIYFDGFTLNRHTEGGSQEITSAEFSLTNPDNNLNYTIVIGNGYKMPTIQLSCDLQQQIELVDGYNATLTMTHRLNNGNYLQTDGNPINLTPSVNDNILNLDFIDIIDCVSGKYKLTVPDGMCRVTVGDNVIPITGFDSYQDSEHPILITLDFRPSGFLNITINSESKTFSVDTKSINDYTRCGDLSKLKNFSFVLYDSNNNVIETYDWEDVYNQESPRQLSGMLPPNLPMGIYRLSIAANSVRTNGVVDNTPYNMIYINSEASKTFEFTPHNNYITAVNTEDFKYDNIQNNLYIQVDPNVELNTACEGKIALKAGDRLIKDWTPASITQSDENSSRWFLTIEKMLPEGMNEYAKNYTLSIPADLFVKKENDQIVGYQEGYDHNISFSDEEAVHSYEKPNIDPVFFKKTGDVNDYFNFTFTGKNWVIVNADAIVTLYNKETKKSVVGYFYGFNEKETTSDSYTWKNYDDSQTLEEGSYELYLTEGAFRWEDTDNNKYVYNSTDRTEFEYVSDYPTIGGIKYELNENNHTAKVLARTNPNAAVPVVIPNTLSTKKGEFDVVEIADKAFYQDRYMVSITLPSTITTIGSQAFQGCNFEMLIVPESLKTVGTDAFKDCTSLKTVINLSNLHLTRSTNNGYIANYVDNNRLFNGAKASEEYIYSNIGNSEDNNVMVLLYTGSSSIFSIPESFEETIEEATVTKTVTALFDNLFKGNTTIQEITIPETVTTIGASAFEGCENLTNVNIPDGVKAIAAYTFKNCGKLMSIELPNGLTSIGASAFEGCENLTNVNIPDGVEAIAASTFKNCGKLTSIELPNGLTSIGESAFEGCNIKNIDLPTSLSSIGKNAFFNNNNLRGTLYLSNNITNISNNAFAGTGISEIYLDAPVNVVKGATDATFPFPANVNICVPAGHADSYIAAGFHNNENGRGFTGNITEANMVFGHETAKTIHDGYPYYCFNENGLPNVEMTYKRNFTLAENAEEGTWQALFVPHAVNVENLGGTVAELKRVYVENGRRYVEWGVVEEGTTLDANKPYIYKPGKSGEHVFTGRGAVHHDDATNSTVSKTEEEFGSFGITLTGVYAPMDVKIGDGNYYLYADGNFKMAGKNSILKPFRVFLTIQNNEPQMATTLYNVLDNGTDTPTAIGVLPFDVLESGVYYDLQGNKVVNPEQGIYILNGKKVVIK